MTQTCAPVVLFAYARPDHLRQTLTALSAADGARESALWVFSDGPRDAAAKPKVEAVRELLSEPGWRGTFAGFNVVEVAQNKGLARSVVGGVSEILGVHDRVVVLEDDLLVAPGFLRFMNAALERHRNTQSVGSITGYCPLLTPPEGYDHDVYAVPRSCSHSWATWSDRWARVDWTGRGAPRLWREPELRQRFQITGTDKLDRLRRQLEGRIDSWSILFNLWHVLDHRVALYPVTNLVENIGFDGSGTHTRTNAGMHTAIASDSRSLDPNLPPEDPRVLKAFRRVYSGSAPGRLRRYVRNLRMPPSVERMLSEPEGIGA